MSWPHPDYLTAFLTTEQLAGWIDYASREPFGFPIEDARAAVQAAVTANAAGPEEPYTADQFLMGPGFADPPNEDGLPSEDALALKIAQLLPPQRPAAPKEG